MKSERPAEPRMRLVVGGGRAPARRVYVPEFEGYIEVGAFPPLGRGDVALNIDPDTLPDVVGDINRAPFVDAAFDEVYFEKVTHEVFTSSGSRAIMETARVTKVGGRLVIETGAGAPLEQLNDALHRAYFKYLRVTRKGFIRITGRRGESK